MVRLYRNYSTSRLTDEVALPLQSSENRAMTCPYCKRALRTLNSDYDQEASYPTAEELHWEARVDVCDTCGWWRILEEVSVLDCRTYVSELHTWAYSTGILRKMDPSGIAEPIEEIERYLLARSDARFQMNPRRFEEVAADVFRLVGRKVILTQYSGDEGIDLILLDAPNNELAAVQVKRHQSKVEASTIREFCGALFLKGIPTGIVVTSSDFTRGAHQTAARALKRGQRIELWSGNHFLDVLGCNIRSPYESANDPSAPFCALWNARVSFPKLGEDAAAQVNAETREETILTYSLNALSRSRAGDRRPLSLLAAECPWIELDSYEETYYDNPTSWSITAIIRVPHDKRSQLEEFGKEFRHALHCSYFSLRCLGGKAHERRDDRGRDRLGDGRELERVRK
jgi:restriction system protein